MILDNTRIRILLGLLSCLGISSSLAEQKCELKPTAGTKFPADFQFGTATAAYQIEGAWNEDGKSPSIWDDYTHEHPELIDDRSNGDVAADSYHLFEKDLAALKELKVQFYRFSIAWTRILPKGELQLKNQKGIDYYNMVIDKLLENNIKPMVSMYHWDMPAELDNIGGFTNPLFIKYFETYAQTLFESFGDRVKSWITFNEPFSICINGYGSGIWPPMVNSPGVTDYICMDTLLKAHAVVYRLYQNKFKDQGGKVGITLDSYFSFSKTNDVDMVNRDLKYRLGWLANPLFGDTGNYPDVMLEEIAWNSALEGRAWSRLPPIDDEWIDIVKGAADFLGLNYYSSSYIEWLNQEPGRSPSFDSDLSLNRTVDPEWRPSKAFWLYCVPQGLEGLLKWVRDNYNNVEVIITENGWSDGGQLDDTDRIDYLKAHLQAIVNAIDDGCNVTHYTHWSLIDNFEWQRGYTEKFGLYSVNVSSTAKDRVPKSSANYYRQVIERRSLTTNKAVKLSTSLPVFFMGSLILSMKAKLI